MLLKISERKSKISFSKNSHLYNYCSNNPLRYIDSLGMFVIDYDNKNIEVNLESKNDIKKAEHFYKYNQNFSLTASIKNGDYITFSDYNAYKIFSEIINGKACKAEDVIVMLGDVTYGISEIGKTVEELTKISTVLGNISTALNFLSTEIDTIQLINDPSYSNAIDLISDALGFIPVYGPMLSKEVQLMDWFCETANAMNYYGNIYLENYYLEKMYESYGF